MGDRAFEWVHPVCPRCGEFQLTPDGRPISFEKHVARLLKSSMAICPKCGWSGPVIFARELPDDPETWGGVR